MNKIEKFLYDHKLWSEAEPKIDNYKKNFENGYIYFDKDEKRFQIYTHNDGDSISVYISVAGMNDIHKYLKELFKEDDEQ